MRASFRALRKDLFELQKTGRGLMLAFIAPALIILLVGQLNVRPPTYRLLIAGDLTDIQSKSINRLETLLRELPGVSIDFESQQPAEPLETARRGSYDLVIVPNELGSGDTVVYSAATEPARVAQLSEFTAKIERTLAVVKDRIKTEVTDPQPSGTGNSPPPTSEDSNPVESKDSAPKTEGAGGPDVENSQPDTEKAMNAETTDPEPTAADVTNQNEAENSDHTPTKDPGQPDIDGKPADPNISKQGDDTSPKQADELRELYAAGIIPPQSLHLYYPRARERSAAFLPMTIALVLCFFPFIIAATALVREKESHTIEILLSAPGMTHNWLFAAKCCLPILVAGFDAVLMFVCAESLYQYYFKSEYLLLGIYVLLAASAATFLGLAVSAVVRTTIQAAVASALYFICLLLFSGFFVDLAQSSGAVRLIANCLPLSTLDQVIKTSMFGGELPRPLALPFSLLFGQTVLFGAIAWISYRRVFVNRL